MVKFPTMWTLESELNQLVILRNCESERAGKISHITVFLVY